MTRTYCYKYAPTALRHVPGQDTSTGRCQCGQVEIVKAPAAKPVLDERELARSMAPQLRECPKCGCDFMSEGGDLYCGGAGACTDGIDVDTVTVTTVKLELAEVVAERFGRLPGEQLHTFIQRVCERDTEDPPAGARA